MHADRTHFARIAPFRHDLQNILRISPENISLIWNFDADRMEFGFRDSIESLSHRFRNVFCTQNFARPFRTQIPCTHRSNADFVRISKSSLAICKIFLRVLQNILRISKIFSRISHAFRARIGRDSHPFRIRLSYDLQNILRVFSDILTNFAPIPNAYRTHFESDAIRSNPLPSHDLQNILREFSPFCKIFSEFRRFRSNTFARASEFRRRSYVDFFRRARPVSICRSNGFRDSDSTRKISLPSNDLQNILRECRFSRLRTICKIFSEISNALPIARISTTDRTDFDTICKIFSENFSGKYSQRICKIFLRRKYSEEFRARNSHGSNAIRVHRIRHVFVHGFRRRSNAFRTPSRTDSERRFRTICKIFSEFFSENISPEIRMPIFDENILHGFLSHFARIGCDSTPIDPRIRTICKIFSEFLRISPLECHSARRFERPNSNGLACDIVSRSSLTICKIFSEFFDADRISQFGFRRRSNDFVLAFRCLRTHRHRISAPIVVDFLSTLSGPFQISRRRFFRVATIATRKSLSRSLSNSLRPDDNLTISMPIARHDFVRFARYSPEDFVHSDRTHFARIAPIFVRFAKYSQNFSGKYFSRFAKYFQSPKIFSEFLSDFARIERFAYRFRTYFARIGCDSHPFRTPSRTHSERRFRTICKIFSEFLRKIFLPICKIFSESKIFSEFLSHFARIGCDSHPFRSPTSYDLQNILRISLGFRTDRTHSERLSHAHFARIGCDSIESSPTICKYFQRFFSVLRISLGFRTISLGFRTDRIHFDADRSRLFIGALRPVPNLPTKVFRVATIATRKSLSRSLSNSLRPDDNLTISMPIARHDFVRFARYSPEDFVHSDRTHFARIAPISYDLQNILRISPENISPDLQNIFRVRKYSQNFSRISHGSNASRTDFARILHGSDAIRTHFERHPAPIPNADFVRFAKYSQNFSGKYFSRFAKYFQSRKYSQNFSRILHGSDAIRTHFDRRLRTICKIFSEFLSDFARIAPIPNAYPTPHFARIGCDSIESSPTICKIFSEIFLRSQNFSRISYDFSRISHGSDPFRRRS